jgi:hypothetical protein
MKNRPLRLAGYGLIVVFAVLALSRDDEHGRDWLSWLPGQVRHSYAHSACGIPVHFVLGDVDPEFGFDRQTVMAALAEAAALWQSHSAAVLLVESDHPRAMTVSLRFDHRQQAAHERHSLRAGLELDRQRFEAEEATLLEWGGRIEAARRAHEAAEQEIARRVEAHEAEVAAWNAGAASRTESRRRALDAEGEALRGAIVDLERQGRSLNADIDAYNRRANDMRERMEEFRARVARFNQAASDAPVESGRYSYVRGEGRSIEVYRAVSYDELVWVLAHEFGHALGIDHVADTDAVMHALLHEGGELRAERARPVGLSDADRRALADACGSALADP